MPDTSHGRAVKSRPENRIGVRFLQAFDVCYARLFHRVIVRSACRLPREGPAIVVSNHVNGLDPLLIQSICKHRLISWMMAKEYFGNPLLDWVFETVEIIPVDRGGRDMGSARAALRALHEGRVVGIFPEGRLPPGRELLPFQTGAALLAARSGAPVYPVYITGTHRGQGMLEAFVKRNTAEVAFGGPIWVGGDGSREGLEGATERIRLEVLKLQSFCRRKNGGKIRKTCVGAGARQGENGA